MEIKHLTLFMTQVLAAHASSRSRIAIGTTIVSCVPVARPV